MESNISTADPMVLRETIENLLRENKSKDDQIELLQMTLRGLDNDLFTLRINHLREITDQNLVISRITMRRLDLEQENQDLYSVLGKITAAYRELQNSLDVVVGETTAKVEQLVNGINSETSKSADDNKAEGVLAQTSGSEVPGPESFPDNSYTSDSSGSQNEPTKSESSQISSDEPKGDNFWWFW